MLNNVTIHSMLTINFFCTVNDNDKKLNSPGYSFAGLPKLN